MEMIQEWNLQFGTGVINIEAVEHNDEIRFNINAFDKYEGKFDNILMTKEEILEIRNAIDEAINTK
jgi:hypothetical protein